MEMAFHANHFMGLNWTQSEPGVKYLREQFFLDYLEVSSSISNSGLIITKYLLHHSVRLSELPTYSMAKLEIF